MWKYQLDDLFQMEPTRRTLLLHYIFIYIYYIFFQILYMFGQLCARHRGNLLYICDTAIRQSVWVAVWTVGWDDIAVSSHATTSQPADQTATHTE